MDIGKDNWLNISKILDENQDLLKIIISNPFMKSAEFFKIIIERKLDNINFYQISLYYENKVKHENYSNIVLLKERLNTIFEIGYKQWDIFLDNKNIKVLMNKKGSVTINEKKLESNKELVLSHNKEKNYILKEGTPVDWLIKLDIMNIDGKVHNKMQKKFKQINRFLEIVDDVIDKNNDFQKYMIEGNRLNIVDIGCGKSYLTFALYYYFKMKNIKVNIVGLDLKNDVVEYCQNLSDKLGFSGLNFYCGDVSNYKFEFDDTNKVHMVVTLHACDTATDYAIFNAIKWEADVILSVPCCQHELNGQINNTLMESMLKHGIVKERLAALLTDSLRGQLLELYDYKVQIMEFIQIEHTAKNLLIRATKKEHTEKYRKKILSEYNALTKEFSLSPKLYNLLKENNLILE